MHRSVTDVVTYLSGSPIIVNVVEPVVNASEGTVAVVCVLAQFPPLSPNFEEFDVMEELVTVNISIVDQGSASMCHI